MDTQQVGQKLVELCREGKNFEAIDTLYSPNIESVEAFGDETMPKVMNGIDAIRGKNQWWFDNHVVHSTNAFGPYGNGDRFAVRFDMDVTAKGGERTKMEEIGLYTVKDGKIVHEEFYYAT